MTNTDISTIQGVSDTHLPRQPSRQRHFRSDRLPIVVQGLLEIERCKHRRHDDPQRRVSEVASHTYPVNRRCQIMDVWCAGILTSSQNRSDRQAGAPRARLLIWARTA